MAEHIAMPEDLTINVENNFETLNRTRLLNLLNKMVNLSSLSSSLSGAQIDDTVLELLELLHQVIGGIKTLTNDRSRPNAIKLAETVIVLLKLLRPGALENMGEEKLDELASNIGENFRDPDLMIQYQNIRNIIEMRLDTLGEDHQFNELKKHITTLLPK